MASLHEHKEKKGITTNVTEAEEISKVPATPRDGGAEAEEPLGTVLGGGQWHDNREKESNQQSYPGPDFTSLKLRDNNEGLIRSELRNRPPFSSG